MDLNIPYMGVIVPAVIILIALFALGLVFARLYHRASKEIAFVRTGLGGERVVRDGGALVLPVLHETIPVNMNTLKLEVLRAREAALITHDRMRVDVQAEFYVRVKPDARRSRPRRRRWVAAPWNRRRSRNWSKASSSTRCARWRPA